MTLVRVEAVESVSGDVDLTGVTYLSGLEPETGVGPVLDPDYLRSRGFEGKAGQTCALQAEGKGYVAVGLGDRSDLTADSYRRAAANFVKAASKSRVAAFSSNGPGQAVAEGLSLGSYQFTKYKSEPDARKLERVEILGADQSAVERGSKIAQAVALARDLINEPAGAMTPTKLAETASSVASDAGLRLEVWDKDRAQAERLGGLLGVAAGTDEPPRMIQLFYEPEGASRTIALVGKGITFDSGGLSIKTADGMSTMKTDMSGAAAVIATMSLVPLLKPNARVVGIAAATENLPGPKATKPGDVLLARNGKTMEVLNTDAEGRLVLADGLSLAVEAGADAIVDIATLTGACVVALGPEIGGLFSNNDELRDKVQSAADAVGEPLWPMPLRKSYRKMIDSDVADVKNIGSPGGAGATTAALFLQEFVDGKPWVHLDIAGPARSDKDDAYIPKGGTGFAVRTLAELVSNF